jgi:DNA-3-methyladenine glycosylase II
VPDHRLLTDDNAVTEELVAVRGFSRWTAERFLIINLNPDLLPLDGVGVLTDISLHDNGGVPVHREQSGTAAPAGSPDGAWRPAAGGAFSIRRPWKSER